MNEIRIRQQLTATKGFATASTPSLSYSVNWSSARHNSETVSASTHPQGFPFCMILSTFGWAAIRNLSTTESVEIGLLPTAVEYGGDFFVFSVLQPGESMSLPLCSNSYYGYRSQGAAADISYLALER